MKLLKVNGKVLGVITDEKLAHRLNLEQAISQIGDPSKIGSTPGEDAACVVRELLASDFTDSETGMVRTIKNYEDDGYIVAGIVMQLADDEDSLMIVLGDGRALSLVID